MAPTPGECGDRSGHHDDLDRAGPDGGLCHPDLAADRGERPAHAPVPGPGDSGAETHVATLKASVSGLEHQERSDYLDRLDVLRTQIFVLDHMYASVLNTLGWLVRLTITLALLASIHPALLLLGVFAVPTVVSSARRPAAERRVEERCAPHGRLAEHFFRLATGPDAGKEVRVTGIAPELAARRRQEWQRWSSPSRAPAG